ALPIHRDGPQRALVASPGPAQRRVRYWPDGEGPPSGRTWILLEPEGVRVQEADHTAFAVVVERLVCLSLLVNPFPVLPDGGRALVQHVQPGRRRALEQQRVCDVGAPVVGKYWQQLTGGEEPCGQVRAGLLDELHETVHRALALLLRQQPEVECADIGGLCVVDSAAVLEEELGLPGRTDLLGPLCIVPGFIRVAKLFGDPA